MGKIWRRVTGEENVADWKRGWLFCHQQDYEEKRESWPNGVQRVRLVSQARYNSVQVCSVGLGVGMHACLCPVPSVEPQLCFSRVSLQHKFRDTFRRDFFFPVRAESRVDVNALNRCFSISDFYAISFYKLKHKAQNFNIPPLKLQT